MATRRTEIIERITDLEDIVRESNAEIDTLKAELTTTPGDLLDRDPDAAIKAQYRAFAERLRQKGVIPR